MATEAEDLAKACELLVYQKQVDLMRVAAMIDNSLEVVEAAFNDYKRSVLRHREYVALAEKYSELS